MINVKIWRLDTDWYPVERDFVKTIIDVLSLAIDPNENKLLEFYDKDEVQYSITEKEDSLCFIVHTKDNLDNVGINIELTCTLDKHSEVNGKTKYIFKAYLNDYLNSETYTIEMIGEIEELIYILKSSKGLRKYNQDIGKSYRLEPVKGITYFDDYIELGENT